MKDAKVKEETWWNSKPLQKKNEGSYKPRNRRRDKGKHSRTQKLLGYHEPFKFQLSFRVSIDNNDHKYNNNCCYSYYKNHG